MTDFGMLDDGRGFPSSALAGDPLSRAHHRASAKDQQQIRDRVRRAILAAEERPKLISRIERLVRKIEREVEGRKESEQAMRMTIASLVREREMLLDEVAALQGVRSTVGERPSMFLGRCRLCGCPSGSRDLCFGHLWAAEDATVT